MYLLTIKNHVNEKDEIMAYSRWSNSDWYIFWHTSSGDTGEEQVLAVWFYGGNQEYFTYKELIDPEFDIKEYFPGVDCLDVEECIKDFIDDVVFCCSTTKILLQWNNLFQQQQKKNKYSKHFKRQK
jgi:hypothetical protein